MISIGRRIHGTAGLFVIVSLTVATVAVTALPAPVQESVKVENAVSVDSSAILETALCLMKSNPGQCVRQQAARVLGNWEDILNTKKMEILAEADKEVTSRQQSRGLSEAEVARGKPSTLMEQIETGLGVLSDFVSEGVDEYVSDEEKVKAGDEATSKTHIHHLLHKLGNGGQANAVLARTETEDYRDPFAAVEDGLVEYAGLAAASPDKALGRGKQEGDQVDFGIGSGEHSAGTGGGSRSGAIGGTVGRSLAGPVRPPSPSVTPVKQAEEKMEQEQETLVDRAGASESEGRRASAAVRFEDDDVGELRRRRKHKHKKKKTFMKLFIIGAALKAKIELLLKILSFKLQLKFFAVALIGLLINIARFWLDFKKQPSPQKVIYYEHAQHQHHYDDHGDDFGGYWQRSLHGVHDDEPYQRQDELNAYRNPKLAQQVPHHAAASRLADPHALAYQQQRPY
ncbi:uncharacterized protein LOC118465518 isoform X2 [Anopheles albimanus]|uniref:uncharacterized protein LOC118465518 isoform X2 n=1 Tax=Anopheles albimanus TaxID=7167 RepID=UPI00163E33E1|nr:uncharacterized protein LOC118465518 isoform X2 [Anopheles albimanus]